MYIEKLQKELIKIIDKKADGTHSSKESINATEVY